METVNVDVSGHGHQRKLLVLRMARGFHRDLLKLDQGLSAPVMTIILLGYLTYVQLAPA